MVKKRKTLPFGCRRDESLLKDLCNHLNITEQELQDFLDFGKEGINCLVALSSAVLLCLLLVLTMGG